MSLLLKSEIKFHGRKQVFRCYDHKIKYLISRRVASFTREHLQPLNQTYFMDLKAAFRLICTNINFILTYKIISIIVFSDFSLKIRIPSVCQRLTYYIKLNFQARICPKQTQWKCIYE
jgi:hypothetical protein